MSFKVYKLYVKLILLLCMSGVLTTRRYYPTVSPRLRDEIEDQERNALCCAKKLKCCRSIPDEPNIEIRAVMVRCPSTNDDDMKRNEKGLINANREDSIKKFPGYDDDEPLTETHIKNCNRKVIITMRIDNKGHISKKSQFVIIDHVFDPMTGKSQRLLNPYVIKLRQDHVTQMYGLRFLNYVNSETKEVIYNKHQSNYTGCNTSRDNPTCGIVTYNDKVIPYSEGFCCSCDSLTNIKRQPKSSPSEKDIKVSYTDPELLMEGVGSNFPNENIEDVDVTTKGRKRAKKVYNHYEEDNEPLFVDNEERAAVTKSHIVNVAVPKKSVESKTQTPTKRPLTLAQSLKVEEDIEKQAAVQRVINPDIKFEEKYKDFRDDEDVIFPYSTEISNEMRKLKHNNNTKSVNVKSRDTNKDYQKSIKNQRDSNRLGSNRFGSNRNVGVDENDETRTQDIVKKGITYQNEELVGGNSQTDNSSPFKFRVEAEVKDYSDTNNKMLNRFMDVGKEINGDKSTYEKNERKFEENHKNPDEHLENTNDANHLRNIDGIDFGDKPKDFENKLNYENNVQHPDFSNIPKTLKADFKLIDNEDAYNETRINPNLKPVRVNSQKQPNANVENNEENRNFNGNLQERLLDSDKQPKENAGKSYNLYPNNEGILATNEQLQKTFYGNPTGQIHENEKQFRGNVGTSEGIQNTSSENVNEDDQIEQNQNVVTIKPDAKKVLHNENKMQWNFQKSEMLQDVNLDDEDYEESIDKLRRKRSAFLKDSNMHDSDVTDERYTKRQISSGGSQIRGGQSCANRYTPPGLNPERYHESTHCLRFSEVWYAVYQLHEPIVEHSVKIQVFEKHEDAYGRTVWRDLTKSKTARLGSLTPIFMDADSTLSITYNSQYTKPNKGNYAINYKSARLLIPEGIDKANIMKYPEVRGGPKEYLIVSPDLIAVDGDRCNVAGVGFEAFYKQPNRCGVPKGSCLTNQPRNLWRHDHKAEKLKRKGCFFLRHYGNLPENPIRKNGSDQLFLSLQYSGSYSSVVDMEIIADSNAALRPSSTAVITEVYIDSTSSTKTILTVKITNGGLISASFYAKLADCPLDLPATFNNIESKVVLIAPQHQHVFTLELRGRLTSDLFHCSVEAINANKELVALRRIKIQKSDRCICTWHCLCACIGSPDGLKCKPMSVEQYHAAGFQGALPIATAVVGNRVVSDVLEMLTFILIFMLMTLLFLGLTKALIGVCCCPPMGMWGLCIILDLPKRMNRYYEKEIRKYEVEYDADEWPVHPVNKKRVRNISRTLEFCANVLFFYTYPIIIVMLLCKRLCCPYYTFERAERESKSTQQEKCDISESGSKTDANKKRSTVKDKEDTNNKKSSKKRRSNVKKRNRNNYEDGGDNDNKQTKISKTPSAATPSVKTSSSLPPSDESEVRKRHRSKSSLRSGRSRATNKTPNTQATSSSRRSSSKMSSPTHKLSNQILEDTDE